MVTEEEMKFIKYWEANRLRQKRLFYQLSFGLPIGLVFGLPILVSVIFSNWYKNMQFITTSQLVIILIAVLGIAVFFALFRMKHKWDMNEQFYKELKFKEGQSEE
jgi:pilus assembly protein TadC